jgi:hypothetical protein
MPNDRDIDCLKTSNEQRGNGGKSQLKLESNLIKLMIAAVMICLTAVPVLALDRGPDTGSDLHASSPNGNQSGDQDGDGQQGPGDGDCNVARGPNGNQSGDQDGDGQQGPGDGDCNVARANGNGFGGGVEDSYDPGYC